MQSLTFKKKLNIQNIDRLCNLSRRGTWNLKVRPCVSLVSSHSERRSRQKVQSEETLRAPGTVALTRQTWRHVSKELAEDFM